MVNNNDIINNSGSQQCKERNFETFATDYMCYEILSRVEIF